MDGNHPKRRKDKYNPYTISEKNGTYLLSFRDGQGVLHNMKISKELFDAFDGFELEDLAILNEWDRHTEQSEQTERTLDRRALHRLETIEEAVERSLTYQQLHSAIAILPEIQRRRLMLYYFHDMTYEQIAEMEGCTFPGGGEVCYRRRKKIKKIFGIGG